MNKKSIFILQGSKDGVSQIEALFNKSEEFEVIGAAQDGMIALTLLSEKTPDLLITDLVITGYDGIKVIKKIREMDLPIKIVVLSALCSEEVVIEATAAGADYYMVKPYDPQNLLERIDELLTGNFTGGKSMPAIKGKRNIDEEISKIFINVGIPPHIKGYGFLREGVKMAVYNPTLINNITKELYPLIGEKYDTTPSKVERAIRHAIEVAWNRGRIDTINNILGVRAFVGAEKPTNGEFIALVADKMMLQEGAK